MVNFVMTRLIKPCSVFEMTRLIKPCNGENGEKKQQGEFCDDAADKAV